MSIQALLSWSTAKETITSSFSQRSDHKAYLGIEVLERARHQRKSRRERDPLWSLPADMSEYSSSLERTIAASRHSQDLV